MNYYGGKRAELRQQ